jgi:plasmid stability protein
VRAAKAGMSLEAYARRALTKASNEEVEEPKPVAELAEAYFGARHGVELPIPPRAIR